MPSTNEVVPSGGPDMPALDASLREELVQEGNALIVAAEDRLRTERKDRPSTTVLGAEATLRESRGEGSGAVDAALGSQVDPEARAKISAAMSGEERQKKYFDPTARSYVRYAEAARISDPFLRDPSEFAKAAVFLAFLLL